MFDDLSDPFGGVPELDASPSISVTPGRGRHGN